MFSSSAAFAWSSPSLPLLLSKNSPIPITSSQSGWIVLAMNIGRAAAVIPGAWSMDRYVKLYYLKFKKYYILNVRFGRKTTLLIGIVPMVAGWIVLISANSVGMIYAARVLWGTTLGMVHSVALPMYLGEISSDKVRGSISTILGVLAKSGICYSFAIGPYVSFRTLGYIEVVPPLLAAFTLPWCPESPYFLMGKNRKDEARASLVKLRGHNDVDEDYKQIEEAIRKSEENPFAFNNIWTARNRPGLIICLGLSYFIVMTGTEAILSFVQIIFTEVNAPIAPELASLLTGGVLVASTILATFIVDKVGRRPLLLVSTVGLFLCNLNIAIYFFLIRESKDTIISNWVPMLAVMFYVVMYGIGLATVAFAVIGEILPKNMKALAGCVLGLTISLTSMVMSKMFQVISDHLGYYVIFAVFTIHAAALFPFVWFCIPETKGKSLNEILDMLEKKKF